MPLVKKLRETEPFCNLPEMAFQELRQSAQLKKFPENYFIFQQNDPPTGFLYVIKEGLVAITALSPGGLDMVVDYRKEGQFFGGTPIFTGEPYSGGAQTVKPTECYLIPSQTLQNLQRTYPLLSSFFTRMVLSRVRKLYSDIISSSIGDSVTQMEAYPFKKRLSEIMSTPVITCSMKTPVRTLARQLTLHDINCLIVVNQDGQAVGMVTGQDLVAKVLAPEQIDEKELTAADIMCCDFHTLPPETYMYEAMAFLSRYRLNYIPVVDRGQPVGVVSPRDLMRYRSQKALLLIGNIREEQTIDGLTAIHREIVKVARVMMSETRSTPEVMEILSYIHHAIIRRTYQLCLDEMIQGGFHIPEVRFCFLIMGSGGRREMLLHPDQDNGFIYEDLPDDQMEEVDAFFSPFSDKLCAALKQVGYPLCAGGVMAKNPAWRGRLNDWKNRISEWLKDPEPMHVRESSIFFDFYPLVGDVQLAHDLRSVIGNAIEAQQGFLYHMMSLDLRYKVPLGMLGRFLVEKEGIHEGKLSLKYGGSVYIVDCVRMFALEKNIQGVTTLERIEALVNHNVFASETAEHIRAAFEALIFLRLRHEIGLVEQGLSASHYIDPQTLSKTEQDLLKEAFQAVSKLQDATKRHFSRAPF
ncbi:MAG: CBS domain-containing protein [Deltaproteobacteria bacterium]|jgi:CBS domain-containing protein|nr:CBS domain-containing protein [Deltaproteobacteria bacterium]